MRRPYLWLNAKFVRQNEHISTKVEEKKKFKKGPIKASKKPSQVVYYGKELLTQWGPL